jgi:hypothetical protein
MHLAAHLERVVDGETVVDPAMAGRATVSAARLQRGDFWPAGTIRPYPPGERGLSNRAIAGRLMLGVEVLMGGPHSMDHAAGRSWRQ